MSSRYRYWKYLTRRRILICIFTLSFLFWLFDYWNFYCAISFDEFKWPPYMDVRKQVELELAGVKSEIEPVNRWSNFQPLAQPAYSHNCSEKSLLIIVKTASERIERRQAYRRTLSTIQKLNEYEIRTIFVMGISEDFNGSSIQKESIFHNDMIIGNFLDTYHNNTLKFMHSLKFSHAYCSSNSPPFVILLDDDYMFKLENAVELIDKHNPNGRLYLGSKVGRYPIRQRFNKFYLSFDEYPFHMFPLYITGGCVIYSPLAIQEFYIAAQYLKLFRFDDVYEGIIAYYLGYNVQDEPNILVIRNNSISWDNKIAEHGYTVEEISNNFFITNVSKLN